MKTKLLLIILGLLIIPFGILVGGKLPYFLLYVFLFTLIIPYIHCLCGKLYLSGKIRIPEKELVTGEEIKITYEIENPLIINFPRLEVENSLALKLTGEAEQTRVYSLKAKESIWAETTVVCRRRGIYQIGEIKVDIKDIFNIFSLKKIIDTPIALKVYPQIIPLYNIFIDTSQDFYYFSELREYQEGDSFKKIHWKASAKKDSLVVKQYEEEGNQEVVIILDSSSDNYKKDYNRWIEDKAVEVVISLAQHFLQKNVKVTLYYQHKKETIEVSGNHYGYLKLFMEEMVVFQTTGEDSYSQYVGNLTSKIKQGSTLYLITPLLDSNLGAEGIRLKMKNLQPRYIVLGDEETDEVTWKKNKEISKILKNENVITYMIEAKQDIKNVLEEKYENRT